MSFAYNRRRRRLAPLYIPTYEIFRLRELEIMQLRVSRRRALAIYIHIRVMAIGPGVPRRITKSELEQYSTIAI